MRKSIFEIFSIVAILASGWETLNGNIDRGTNFLVWAFFLNYLSDKQ